MRRSRRLTSITGISKKRGRGASRAPQFLPQSRCRPGGCSRRTALRSATAAGAAAGIAFEAGAVTDEGEVAAFAATVALVTLHSCCLDLLQTDIHCLDWLDLHGDVVADRDVAGGRHFERAGFRGRRLRA